MPGRQGGGGGRRWLTLVSGLVECLCFAGLVFGWASLVFVLKEDGYFNDGHLNTTGANNSVFRDDSDLDGQFSMVFTVASFLNNFFMLLIGPVFDHFGTMAARLLAISLYTTGTLMVAFSTAATARVLFPALSFMSIGGMLFLVTNMQVGNLFGSHRSTIITLYNGAFDSSSAVFLIIKVLHEHGVSLRSSFLFMSSCSIIHLLRTFFLLPKTHIPHPLPENYTYGLSCGKSGSSSKDGAWRSGDTGGHNSIPFQPENELQSQSSEERDPSFRSCVLSWFFLGHLVWFSLLQVQHYLFIGTLNPTLTRLAHGDHSLVSRYTNAFAIAQLCGVLCAPWNGLIMDRNKGKQRAPGETEKEADLRSSALSLFTTSLLCLLFSVCASIPVLPLQYLTFSLQVASRSFLYGGNAAFISIAFPGHHFGKLYGLVMCLSAVVSLLQYLCSALVKGPFHGDPLYVNMGLTVAVLLTFSHSLHVFLRTKRPRQTLSHGPSSLSTSLF
ncbi:equilibrative nucleobase transporter 1-like isoform X2 [Conger conger]|uniref:equilibrative nucleobase transporter 1-like isoform X2 n=1 Tax=Conger conger TaxID=82655 RepID=UPI002A5A2E74|nr:equilibrative nucleobase transporter 1-like isoform X2 [Conger conger]